MPIPGTAGFGRLGGALQNNRFGLRRGNMKRWKASLILGVLAVGIYCGDAQAQFCERYGYIWNFCATIVNNTQGTLIIKDPRSKLTGYSEEQYDFENPPTPLFQRGT